MLFVLLLMEVVVADFSCKALVVEMVCYITAVSFFAYFSCFSTRSSQSYCFALDILRNDQIAFFPENLIPLAEFVRVRLYRSSSPGPVPEQIFKNLVQLHLEADILSRCF